MSYSACSNSAIFKPDAYPRGAIGSIITPTLNFNPVASGALLQPISALTLPEGVWLLSGTLFVDASVGGQTITGQTGVAKDAVVFWRSQSDSVGSDGTSVSLSAVLSSDGTNVLTIPMTYATSAGATYGIGASPLTIVQLTRVA